MAIHTEREKVEPWIAFLTALRGPLGTFLMGDPLGKTPRELRLELHCVKPMGKQETHYQLRGGRLVVPC